MKIAVIVLNYNSSSDCYKCISFLKKQQGIDIEIVIVDNCSVKDDLEKLKVLCHDEQCTLIENSENRGYNVGNNIGLRYAARKGYKYALIANPDMEFPQTTYISQIVTKLEINKDIVVLGTNIRTLEGEYQNPKKRDDDDWRKCFNWVKDILKCSPRSDTPIWVDNPHKSCYCRSLNGCCLILRISFLQNIGFFDENIFLYGEESVLGKQVELAQKKMFYYAETYAIHNHQKNKERSYIFRFKHWRHSQIHYTRCYSQYPLYGKLITIFSINIYFFVLTIHNWMIQYLKSIKAVS